MTLSHRQGRALFILAASLFIGCAAPPAPETAPAAPVKWEAGSEVVLEDWEELYGVTQPLPDCIARITAPIDGRIVSILKNASGKDLHEGDLLPEGEVIARLDDRISKLNRDKAESAVKTAAEDKSQAQTALNLASDRLTSLKALRLKTPALVPEIDLKTAEGAEQDARSKLHAAEQRQDQATKDYEALKQQLTLYTLTTPHKGRLSRVQATVGQTLAVGAEIAQVVDLEDQIDFLCSVSPRTVARLQLKQAAGVGGLDEKPGEVRTGDASGQVVYIADQAEPETGCFTVKVRFPNKDLHLRGNVIQRVRILLHPGEAHLAIPETALMEDQDPPSVVIVEDVKTVKNSDNKEEQVGTARRLRAVVGVHDRLLKQVGIVSLQDPEGAWKGELDKVLFIIEKGQGLQTGDPVRLEEEDN